MSNTPSCRWLRGGGLSFTLCAILVLGPLQIGGTLAADECKDKPCDCNGPFNPPTRITDKELANTLAAHHEWVTDAKIKNWTIEEQIQQYDPDYNPPESGSVGKYPCEDDRNGPKFLGAIDIARSDISISSPERDLRGVCFRKSDLRKVKFNDANLEGANFYKADLSGASLVDANLTGAILDCANLRGADLTGATLTESNLYRALLDRAFFNHAHLAHARFEPIELPPVRNLWEAQGLEKLHWEQNPSGLFALREGLRRAGQDYRARRVTYAIEHQNTAEELGKWDESPLSPCIGLLRLVFIEWTTGYGLYPFRALGILLVLVVAFAFIYVFPLRFLYGGGIYRKWPSKRLKETGCGVLVADREEVERLRPWGLAVVGYALWFSLLSAFNMGWRELNVGSWLARLQARDYLLQATSWVRVVSGTQSLTSVYLLAIWALTYFGRPFG